MAFSGQLNALSTFYMVGKAGWNIYKLINTPNPAVDVSDNPYRPPEWFDRSSSNDDSELIQIIPNNISETQWVKTGTSGKSEQIVVGYFFDTFLRENHTGSVRVTEHPVQDGTSISDHAYNLQDRLSLEILTSDVMDEVVVGQFSEYETKSISAYQILRALKEQRMPLSVNTRLHFYENMIIETMSVNDDYKEKYSLRCTVSLKQVMTAYVAVETATSSKPQVTGINKSGPKQTKDVNTQPTLLQNVTTKRSASSQKLINQRYGQ